MSTLYHVIIWVYIRIPTVKIPTIIIPTVSEQFHNPYKNIKIPTDSFKIPTDSIKIPTHSIKIPTENIKIPTDPIKIPTKCLQSLCFSIKIVVNKLETFKDAL